MADGVVRVLRDGVLEGEQAPCILVHTSLDTAAGSPMFHHFLQSLHANISAGRAQARGMVAVATTSPPRSYERYAEAGDAVRWFQVVDCFSDPLGWEQSLEAEEEVELDGCSRYRDMSGRLDGLLALVVAAGRAAARHQPGGNRFAVLVDSVSDLLRYQRENLPAVAGFVSSLRSHAEVSALVLLVRADCHDARTVSGLAYHSSVNVFLEPHPSLDEEALIVLERNMSGGRLRVRQRRRNGRYREEVEEFQVEDAGLRFSTITGRKGPGGAAAGGISQVKFNLQLSATELAERAKVVLPFEHQGQGKQIQIYDGRPDASALGLTDLAMSEERISASEGVEVLDSTGAAEIHYVRDSDDEVPDSDEDPDDDLDI